MLPENNQNFTHRGLVGYKFLGCTHSGALCWVRLGQVRYDRQGAL